MYGWRDAALDFIVGLVVVAVVVMSPIAIYVYHEAILGALKAVFIGVILAAAAFGAGHHIMRDIAKIKPFGAAKTKEESK